MIKQCTWGDYTHVKNLSINVKFHVVGDRHHCHVNLRLHFDTLLSPLFLVCYNSTLFLIFIYPLSLLYPLFLIFIYPSSLLYPLFLLYLLFILYPLSLLYPLFLVYPLFLLYFLFLLYPLLYFILYFYLILYLYFLLCFHFLLLTVSRNASYLTCFTAFASHSC